MKADFLTGVLCLILIFFGCSAEEDSGTINVTDLSITAPGTSVDIGDELQLTAVITPADATDTSVTWSTADADTATVDQTGLVQGVFIGTVTITAVSTDGGFTAEQSITVDTAGWGSVTGSNAGLTSTQLTDSNSYEKALTIECEDDFIYADLCPDAQHVYDDDNSGGSSIESECIAMEILYGLYGAVLLKTESEIVYADDMGKKADFLVSINAQYIGVTVVRAVAFPYDTTLADATATAIVEGKLQNVIDANTNIEGQYDEWNKQILIFMTSTSANVAMLNTKISDADSSLKADTIIIVVLTNGEDSYVY